mmetsp:Transcript_1214/g.1381  ORF Transcript_1214/g.1381 Transcript_1214/m.1381 type:complete len:85 (-) Transcript_1214:1477-1731(-)
MQNLKRENGQLGITLKRYRQMLQDLTTQKKGGTTLNMLDNLNAGKNMQSQTSMRQGGLSQLGKQRLNRSESGSSIMSSVAAHAN